MNWKPGARRLARREAFAREMGGVDKVKRQRRTGPAHRPRADRQKLVDETASRGRARFPVLPNMTNAAKLKKSNSCQLRVRPRQDRAGRLWSSRRFHRAWRSADASISTKPLMAEEMAHDFLLRSPHHRRFRRRRFGETIETKGAANLQRHRRHPRVLVHTAKHGPGAVVGWASAPSQDGRGTARASIILS